MEDILSVHTYDKRKLPRLPIFDGETDTKKSEEETQTDESH